MKNKIKPPPMPKDNFLAKVVQNMGLCCNLLNKQNMKKALVLIIAIFSFVMVASAVSAKAEALQKVKGYTNKSGTYVAPHYKSSPNKSKFDNFSTKGNYNPYTGKKGSVNPFKY